MSSQRHHLMTQRSHASLDGKGKNRKPRNDSKRKGQK